MRIWMVYALRYPRIVIDLQDKVTQHADVEIALNWDEFGALTFVTTKLVVFQDIKMCDPEAQ
jgi:hypothetical protein